MKYDSIEKVAAVYDAASAAHRSEVADHVLEVYKEAAFGAGLLNAGKAIAGAVGQQVSHGAASAAGAAAGTLGRVAPNFVQKYSPQIAKGIGTLAAHPVATGAAALGTAGAGLMGAGAVAGRMTAPRQQSR